MEGQKDWYASYRKFFDELDAEKMVAYAPQSDHVDDMCNSQGFFASRSEDRWIGAGAVWRIEDRSDSRFENAVVAAEFAFKEHNKAAAGEEGALKFLKHEYKAVEEGPLKFLEILNLNFEPGAGCFYYITAAAEDAAGVICRYEVKVWQTYKGVLKVHILKRARYWLKPSEKAEFEEHRMTVKNLLPWMDENYLFYKNFRASPRIRGVEVIGGGEAHIWFESTYGKEYILDTYGDGGWKMPYTDIICTFVI